MVEYYNEKIAKSTNVELVHISCDQDEAGIKQSAYQESSAEICRGMVVPCRFVIVFAGYIFCRHSCA